MKKSGKVVGTWRFTDMEAWDADYFDMDVPACMTIRDDLTGVFQFGLVQGDIEALWNDRKALLCCGQAASGAL